MTFGHFSVVLARRARGGSIVPGVYAGLPLCSCAPPPPPRLSATAHLPAPAPPAPARFRPMRILQADSGDLLLQRDAKRPKTAPAPAPTRPSDHACTAAGSGAGAPLASAVPLLSRAQPRDATAHTGTGPGALAKRPSDTAAPLRRALDAGRPAVSQGHRGSVHAPAKGTASEACSARGSDSACRSAAQRMRHCVCVWSVARPPFLAGEYCFTR